MRLAQRAFFVGPNASGKSNLLDALRFLRDIASVGGGFEQAVERRGGLSSIRCLSARRDPNVVIGVNIGDWDGKEFWSYQIVFTQDKKHRPILKKEVVTSMGQNIVNRTPADEGDSDLSRQTWLQQATVNKSFRRIAEFFASVQYLHVVPQLIREPDRSVGRVNDPYGGDFLKRVAKTNKKTRDYRFRRIRDALRVAVPQFSTLTLATDVLGRPHLKGKYDHWRPQGAWQTEEVFSDGTLRLFGLLWSLLEGQGPLLLEEPEMSLHEEVVRELPRVFWKVQQINGRQVIISTHSSDLLSDEGIGLDEVVMFSPSAEGTIVRAATDFQEIRDLLDGGLPMGEVVVPRTRPTAVGRLGKLVS